MNPSQQGPFHLNDIFAFLQDGGEAPIIVKDAGFWQDLMSGEPASPGAALVAKGSGWLVGVYSISDDPQTWEMHPSGDELPAMLTGEMDVVLELADGEVTITPRRVRRVWCRAGPGTGRPCVVPAGI